MTTPPWSVSADGRSFLDPGTGWEPLTLVADEVVAVVVDRFGLPARTARLLPGGLLNQTWRVEVEDSHDRVVRVSRSGRTLDEVAWEAEAVRRWRTTVPEAVAAEADPTTVAHRVVTLFPHVATDEPPGRDGPDRQARFAEVLARLHRAAVADPMPQRPGGRALDRSEEDPFGWRALRTALLERPASDDHQAVIATVDRHLTTAHRTIDALGDPRRGPRAQVWGDLNPRNRLYRRGRLVALVDSDDCSVQLLATDLAKECWADPGCPPQEFLAAYRAAGGPVGSGLDELRVFRVLGAAAELLWVWPYGDRTRPVRADAVAVVADVAARLEALG